MLKKKNAISVSIVALLLVLLAFVLFVQNSKDLFQEYYDSQLNNYSNLFKKTIEIAEGYTSLSDELIAEEFYQMIVKIEEELADSPLENMRPERLERLKNHYGLSELAILSKDHEGIYIYSSTMRGEIGQRTEEWGYWNQAFEELFEGQKVSLDLGQGNKHDNYWLGPRSKSHYAPGFFRYAYLYNEEGDYLLNIIMEEHSIYQENLEDMLGGFFEHLYKDISYIEAAALIDIKAWEKSYNNGYKNLESASYLYGNFSDHKIMIESKLKPEDLYAIETSKSIELNYMGKEKSLFLISAGEENHPLLIALLIDDHEADGFVNRTGRMFLGLLTFTFLVTGLAIFYNINKYRHRLTLEMERNEEMERFIKNVAMIPEITYRAKMIDGEGQIAFVYGQANTDAETIALDEGYHPIKNLYCPDYVKEFEKELRAVLAGQTRRFEIVHQDIHYEHFLSPSLDKEGKILEAIGIANNISRRKMEEEKAKFFASHDFLTNLLNRRAFEEEIGQKLDQDDEKKYALVILDLDGFKNINDKHGHLAGDQILKDVASRMKVFLGKEYSQASLARMGGDEFAIFTSFKNMEQLEELAQGLVEILKAPYQIKNQEVQLGVSLGIALYGNASKNYSQLFYCADMAMYQAKKSGGNSYNFC